MRLIDLYKSARERRVATYSLTLVRVLVGATFIAHGWQELGDIGGTIMAFRQLGFPALESSVYLVISSELLGGLGLLFGLHFAIRGAGAYSVDAVVAPRRPRFRRRQVAVTT